MWVFLIHIALVVIFWVLYFIGSWRYEVAFKHDHWDNKWDGFKTVILVVAITLSFITFAHCVAIGAENIRAEAGLTSKLAERDAIIYEIDNGILVGDSLSDFNSDVAYYQYMNDNPWFDWYYSDLWDQVEMIPTDVK